MQTHHLNVKNIKAPIYLFSLLVLFFTACINNPSQPVVNQPAQVQTAPSKTSVPQNAQALWESIKQTGHAPDGYGEARPFENREGLLPAQDANGSPISYQVWNVGNNDNGKPSREKLVTGSDHRAWFTNDGFHSFAELGSNTVVGNPKNTRPDNTSNFHHSSNVPQNVNYVLQYVKQNGHAPDGYVGGRVFGNYEHRLPESAADGSRISYQEWDVNPKVQGRNRGTDRLITGSDGRSWYTNDHYNSFVQVQ
jgi:ribonuclease T1